MGRRALLGVAITLIALPATTFPQAAAEYGMTVGKSATSTVKAGSAINEGAQRLAGRVQDALGKSIQDSTGKSIRSVNLMEENKRKLEAKSEAGGGTIRIESAPQKATILVDGAEVGYTPASLKVPEGKHIIELRHATSLPWRKEIIVGRNDNLSLKTDLENKYKSVVNLSFGK